VTQKRRRTLLGVLAKSRGAWDCFTELLQNRLDFLVGVPLLRLVFEHEIAAHTAASKVLDAFIVLGPVGMCIEMARTGVPNIFEKLHQPEAGLDIRGSEAQILVVAPGHL